MALNKLDKLNILFEKPGQVLVFDKNNSIEVLFNPDKLVFTRSVSWTKESSAQRDVPELQFSNAQARTLKIDLIFDTYDNDKTEEEKEDVQIYTKKLLNLTTVESHGDKHRPPVCRLSWGQVGVFFQGVLEQLEQQFTLFLENGTPVRATSACTFKEWRTNYEDLRNQGPESSDIAKKWIVKRGDTLISIAAMEYRDPGLWRHIADENDIDDPLSLPPGMTLLIPSLTHK